MLENSIQLQYAEISFWKKVRYQLFKPTLATEMTVNKWSSMAEFCKTQPDENQYLWLSEYGSMTRRLIEAGMGALNVELVTSQHRLPFKEESSFLQLPQRQWSYIREVIMQITNTPWMCGRTVIPDMTINSGAGQLKLLGKKPLGKVLFDHNKSTRVFIEIAKISKEHFLYPDFIDDHKHPFLWARRSLFNFNKGPILVQEVFLPDCPFQLPVWSVLVVMETLLILCNANGQLVKPINEPVHIFAFKYPAMLWA